jgi:hypothetical protein
VNKLSILESSLLKQFLTLVFLLGIRAIKGQPNFMILFMMDTSNTAPTFFAPNITLFLFVKLDEMNYLGWTSTLMPIIRTHDLLSIVDGSKSCPSQFLLDAEGKPTSKLDLRYYIWQKKDIHFGLAKYHIN